MQSCQKNQARQQRGQGGRPNEVCRKIDSVGKESPCPTRPSCRGFAETLSSDEVNRDASQSRKQAVHNQRGNRRRLGVNSEDLENSRQKVRKHRRQPRRGARLAK